MKQLELKLNLPSSPESSSSNSYYQMLELKEYDKILIAFSGGKDSLACLLHVLELGVSSTKIELWHHCIDGHDAPDVGEKRRPLMDWACTPEYCRAIAKHFEIPFFLSWRSGGFEKEMLRDNEPTAKVWFETPSGLSGSGGNSNKLGKRHRFPMPIADLKRRWCSSVLKISVMESAIRNQERFEGIKTLVITGERAEESTARSKYLESEIHRSDARGVRKRRHVDHWRPVLRWKESKVWEIIERWQINPHPAYRLGWGRVSCMACIFGSNQMWASIGAIAPATLQNLTNYEVRFDSTIKIPVRSVKKTVTDLAQSAEAYPNMQQKDIDAALSYSWNEPVQLENWKLPPGAYGDSAGSI